MSTGRATVRYADGRVQVGTAPPDPVMGLPLYSSDDPFGYGLAEWQTWAKSSDERLDAIAANTFDIGDRVHRAGVVLYCAIAAMAVQWAAFIAIIIVNRR